MPVLDPVIRYHEQTKHHFFRYAKSVGYLDWANQPDPFRRYLGAPLVPLPILTLHDSPISPPYADLYRPGAIPVVDVSLRSLSRFLEHALALTAWKQAGGSRWALRSNPSSGNLHPTEGYILARGLAGLAPSPALYHYAPKEHGLELRGECDPDAYARLMQPFPPGSFLFGLTSILWREAWKYGERAFRYCQHDAGHAIGSARIAAATLGWRMVLLEELGDDALAALLGVNRSEDYAGAEREHTECLAVVWPDEAAFHQAIPLQLETGPLGRLLARWHGKANRLSTDDPVPWEIIEEVAQATWKPEGPTRAAISLQTPDGPGDGAAGMDGLRAGEVIRQRRSAVAFDAKTSIPVERFYVMLERAWPAAERELSRRPMPWDVWPWEPCILLALFVHRVDGLAPGLYGFLRDLRHLAPLREAMQRHFHWARPAGCPDSLPLYLLEEGDARRVAVQVSCHQDIAGDGAFSLGMIAEFEGALERHGPWFYRRLFWETGLIGQILYLEAEAAGVRATGIGCFFDDPMHQVLGLQGRAFQSLYHFTTGGPVDDPRLTTLPPYGAELHERR